MRPLRRAPARLLAALVLTAVVASGLQAVVRPEPAQAAVASGFDPGNIISDPVFKDSGSMSAAEVQAFLESRNSGCAAGATCLEDYRETTVTRPTSPGLCWEYTGRPQERASEIIVRVAQACGINPQVLVVMLEKEQGLVTATNPSAEKYRKALGYACPDTGAGCDEKYFGFFNQLYSAARQFLVYANNPSVRRYRAGRDNIVLWHPNQDCGSSTVRIVNQATAGLYNYTPYQPNAAALGNLYGSGDACSAYGNRNFWRDFTDWFGNPQTGGFFVKASGPAVYLVADDRKLPVGSMSTVEAYSALGGVGTVSQAYLDGLPTGPRLRRTVVGPDGTVWYVAAGSRHRVPTCEMAADYGYGCADLPRLTDVQLAAMPQGPELTTAFLVKGSGVLWAAEDGARREVLDFEALDAARIPRAWVTLDAGAAPPVGAPIVRPDVLVTARGTTERYLVQADGTTTVDDALYRQAVLSRLPSGQLELASARALGARGATTGVVTDGSGTSWLLTSTGRARTALTGASAGAAARWSRALLDRLPEAREISLPILLKATTKSSVQRFDGATRRPVSSWDDLVAVSGTSTPPIGTVPDAVFDALAAGPAVLSPGTLVKSADSSEVSLVDGAGSLWRLPSFAVSDALGVRGWTTVPAAALGGYRTAGDLSTVLSCGPGLAVGAGGRTRPLAAGLGAGLPTTDLQPATCGRLVAGSPALGAPLLVQAIGQADVHLVQAGAKRRIATWGEVQRLAGTASPTLVVLTPQALSSLPSTAG